MELYLQMGHGMQKMAEDLICSWGSGKIIISPVNIAQDRLQNFSKRILSAGGELLFDPQMFYPRDGHEKLRAYDYWPQEGATISSEDTVDEINRELLRLNRQISSSAIILPGVEMQENALIAGLNLMNKSADYFSSKCTVPLYATLCLYPETIRNTEIIELLVEQLRNVSVDGFYIIPHPANSEYIVSDPLWMMGMLKLLTCLKLAGKKTIVGYSNHQGLVYSLSHTDAIAAGNYMNTRSFMPAKFKSPKDDDIKHKSTWYYLPSAFCEYKATVLDIAMQRGYLDAFKPQGNFLNKYSSMLFGGAQPSSTNYKETNSFMHYLWCLREQCVQVTKNSYRETYDTYDFLISTAENQIREFKKRGVSGQNRDFAPAIEANRIAMCANDEDYGFKLNIDWNK